jgi:hypothetical protein
MTTLRALIDSSERPSIDTVDGLNYVLKQLRRDNSTDISDVVTPRWSLNAHLTFEELIGILLKARDEIARHRAEESVESSVCSSSPPFKHWSDPNCICAHITDEKLTITRDSRSLR